MEHPVLAAAHTSAVLLGKACDGTAWQLGDDDVEAVLEGLDQASVVVEVFDDLDRLDRDQPLLADAQVFLLDQTSALGPRDLKRAGQALVEQLTNRPSHDSPGDAAAVRAELDAAEHALARAEWNTLTVTRRPGGRLRGRFDLNPLDAAAVFPWLKLAGRPLPGADGFEDDRPRDRRLGDALAALPPPAASPTETEAATATATACSRQRAPTRASASLPPLIMHFWCPREHQKCMINGGG